MKLWNTIGVIALHIFASVTAFLSGLSVSSSAVLAGFLGMTGALLISAIISRALRVDDECDLLMSALDTPAPSQCDSDDEITQPQIRYAEPTTGVKHKAIADTVPNVVTWHGRRGRS